MSKRSWDEDGSRPLLDILHYVFFSQPAQCQPIGRTFLKLPLDVLFSWTQVLVRRTGLMKTLTLTTRNVCQKHSMTNSSDFIRGLNWTEPKLLRISVSLLNSWQMSWICNCNPDGNMNKTISGPLQPILFFFLMTFAQLSASLLLDGKLEYLFTLNKPFNDFVHTYRTDWTEKCNMSFFIRTAVTLCWSVNLWWLCWWNIT